MTLSQKQKHLIRDLTSVLKKYSGAQFNPQVVVEVLTRAMRRNHGKRRNLNIVNTLPIPEAQAHEVVREQRTRLGLSMQQLAKKTGIAQPNLSAIENGKRVIGAAVAKKLGKALKVNYRVFL